MIRRIYGFKDMVFLNTQIVISVNRIVLVLLLLLYMVSGCKNDDNDELPVGSEVQMTVNSFLPQTLTVTSGTAVKWTNSSQVAHTVTDSEGYFDELLSPGDTFVYTFSTAGTYSYVCSIHTGMSGVIIVE